MAAAAASILKMFLREPALCDDLAIVEELRLARLSFNPRFNADLYYFLPAIETLL